MATRSEIVPIDQRHEVVTVGERVPAIANEVRALQDMTAIGFSRFARRVVFLWFRIFVLQQKDGRKEQRVDIRIPIPLPLVGMVFPRSIGWRHALAAIAAARDAQEPTTAMRNYLDAIMAFEFIRVEEEKPGKRELVVIGFD